MTWFLSGRTENIARSNAQVFMARYKNKHDAIMFVPYTDEERKGFGYVAYLSRKPIQCGQHPFNKAK